METKRKLEIITGAVTVGLAAYCLMLKEEEDAEQEDAEHEDAEERDEDEEGSKEIKRRARWDPYLRERRDVLNTRTRTPQLFFENFHMSAARFNHLFSLVEPHLIPNRNSRPDAIPLKVKFAVVLEMLATGVFQNNLASSYRISKQHIGPTIDRVCDAICLALTGEFPKWNKQNMLKWADKFERQFNFPNCLGAIAGKHVPTTVSSSKKRDFLNYKGFTSIVLIAVCDASSKFTYIDVGAYGSQGDTAFAESNLGDSVLCDNMEFPKSRMLNGVSTPYFLVGNEGFPLDKHLMKAYGQKTISEDEQTFNYRLNQSHRCIGKAFEILCARWMAMQRTSLKSPNRAQKMVAACCYLHNYMMRTCPADFYIPKDLEAHRVTALTDLAAYRGRYNDYPKYVRNNIKDYIICESRGVSRSSD